MKFLNRNNVFLTLIAVVIIGIIFGSTIGARQEQDYLRDFQDFKQVYAYLERGDMVKASSGLIRLAGKYPDNVPIQYMYAWTLGQKGEYKEAIAHYESVRSLRPFVLENEKFLFSFGEVLYKHGQYSRAKLYLEQAQITPPKPGEPDNRAEIGVMLSEIEKKGMGS